MVTDRERKPVDRSDGAQAFAAADLSSAASACSSLRSGRKSILLNAFRSPERAYRFFR